MTMISRHLANTLLSSGLGLAATSVGQRLKDALKMSVMPERLPFSSSAARVGGYNRHRAITAAASKRAAAKRRNIAKRSPH